jgi:hypothetical protein
MNKEELNLDNPIFIVYVNVDNMSRQTSENLLDSYQKMLSYKNCTFWVVPVQEQMTKFEIIWKGKDHENSNTDSEKSIRFLKEKMTNLMDMIADGISDDVIKQKLRDFSLNQLIDE